MKNLSLFTISVYLEDNIFTTVFRTFAKNEKEAIRHVTDFIEQHVTDSYTIREMKQDKIEDGKVLY